MTSLRTWQLSIAAIALMFGFIATATAAGENENNDAPYAQAIADATEVPTIKFDGLDMDKIAREDDLADYKGNPGGFRFAVPIDIDLSPANAGTWTATASGKWLWRLKIETPDAVHLNFGFKHFKLPPSAEMLLVSGDGKNALGPLTAADNRTTGEMWTQVLLGRSALLQVTVATGEQDQLVLNLTRIGQGYRGFGFRTKHCKSGACNTDVACLGSSDPWNNPRRSVGAITVGGSDTCTGSLLNNTNNDRRLLFATASHCGITGGNVASVLVYWNYESPTCRTPGSAASGTPTPRPSTTSSGQTFLAQTPSAFTGSAGPRSDWTLIELAGTANPAFNLYWAGWDRRSAAAVCAAPADPASTVGLCAGIHHPGVDEKRITFVQQNFEVGNISSAVGVHWHAFWDPTPPILPNLPPPAPASLPPSVTEGGSSGSPLYTAQQRIVGVLSGGPSACGSTGANLSDFYGALFHSFDGDGTPTTRMKDYLDPTNSGVEFIDGINQCNAPTVPLGVDAVASAPNQITLNWNTVASAERYRVYRSNGACPGTSFTQIAEVTAPTTTYNDTTVSGGSTYSYSVTSFDDAESCESPRSTCDSEIATGVCSLGPSFTGVVSAASAATASCAINVNWSAGAGNCGGGSQVRYNVFRDITSAFTPSAANRVQTCSTGTSYQDSGVTSGTRYYYVVRAEDQGATGSGGACGGVQESNIVQRSAVPNGPVTGLTMDNVEGAADNFVATGSGDGADFSISTAQARSPTHAWFVPDPETESDRRLTYAAAIPVGASPGSFNFWHRYLTEAPTTGTGGFDGGVLEYSLDGGITWSDILAAQGPVPANAARITAGGYNRTISTEYNSALSGRLAWSGDSGTFVQTTVSLADFANRSVTFRFRFASDRSVTRTGWFIDDIDAPNFSACGPAVIDPIFSNGFEASSR